MLRGDAAGSYGPERLREAEIGPPGEEMQMQMEMEIGERLAVRTGRVEGRVHAC